MRQSYRCAHDAVRDTSDVMGEPLIVSVVMPPADAPRVLELIPRVVACLGALWETGRLRPLLESEEGRDVLLTFQSMVRDVQTQLSDAVGMSMQTARVRVQFEESSGRATAAFIRRVLDMMSDPKVIGPLGAQEISGEDRSFLEPYLQVLERAVASAEEAPKA
jgi:hypothetical protein